MIVEKVNVASCAKMGGMLMLLLGAAICVPVALYGLATGKTLLEAAMIAVFGPPVACLDGIIAGALVAACYNLAARKAGGLELTVRQ